MHQDFGFSWKLTGKIKDTLNVLKTWGIRIGRIAGVLEKTEKQFSSESNCLDQLAAALVVFHVFLPDRNDVGPPFPLLLR